ncbi:flagellar motor switch protein FliN [Lamprobacter modestohalophilus]|uniref:Flagellar motor switch protein FliN n=2 Tax=Lamprobacter modestohalophilus TaxID=1064514 RepID=A0A9X1B487_9GAMM|nr:flagellar motor switch protein FliN [Lamprobacter modestohalophilus]
MTEQDKAEENAEPNEDTAADSVASDKATEAGAEGAEEGAEEEIDLWAEAMAEQEAHEATNTESDNAQAEESDDDEDLWAAAMAEQTEATSTETDQPTANAATQPDARTSQAPPAADKQPEVEAAGERVFRPLEQSSQVSETRDLAMILDIPVRLSVELGRTKVTIKELLEMAQGSVVELDGLAGEPMDILINGYLIAQGEVVVVEDKYGIRITEIVTPSERVQKLNR